MISRILNDQPQISDIEEKNPNKQLYIDFKFISSMDYSFLINNKLLVHF